MTINRIRQLSTHTHKKVEKYFEINNCWNLDLQTGYHQKHKTLAMRSDGVPMGTFWQLEDGRYAVVTDMFFNIIDCEELENINKQDDIKETHVFYKEVDNLLEVLKIFFDENHEKVESAKLVVDNITETTEREEINLQ